MLTQLLNISSESIEKAATAIRKGGLVIYPTDTVYGLGCDPFDDKSVDRLATLKGRSKGNLPVLVDTFSGARELGDISGDVETLALRYWPGPLTIVVPSRETLSLQIIGPEKMVGLRIPRRQDTLNLISKSGGALVGTSANISGKPSLRNAEDAFKVFDGKVDIVLNGGITSTNLESTVVKQGTSGIRVLREGAIPPRDLRMALDLNPVLQK
jgi:L-threonylcarbamoyladenylate synthase